MESREVPPTIYSKYEKLLDEFKSPLFEVNLDRALEYLERVRDILCEAGIDNLGELEKILGPSENL